VNVCALCCVRRAAGALVQGPGVPLWTTYVDMHRAVALASQALKKRREPRSYLELSRKVGVGACYVTGHVTAGVAALAVRLTGVVTGSVAGGVALGGLGFVGGTFVGAVGGTLGGAYGGGGLLTNGIFRLTGELTFKRPVAAAATVVVATAAAAVGAAGGAVVGLVGGTVVGGLGGTVVGGGVGAYYTGDAVLSTIDATLQPLANILQRGPF
jgi:hypothetical protein